MLVLRGRYLHGYLSPDLEYVVTTDHHQVAHLLSRVARHFGIYARWYDWGDVPQTAVAIPQNAMIIIDQDAADKLVVLHGEVALLFVVLHELGHLRTPWLQGRDGERAADAFAAATLVALGYTPSAIIVGAAASLAGSPDDGVHDAGWKRLRLVQNVVMRRYR